MNTENKAETYDMQKYIDFGVKEMADVLRSIESKHWYENKKDPGGKIYVDVALNIWIKVIQRISDANPDWPIKEKENLVDEVCEIIRKFTLPDAAPVSIETNLVEKKPAKKTKAKK